MWVPCLWEVITGSVWATLCLFACSMPCNLCLQYVDLSPLLFTVASVFSLQQIGTLKWTVFPLVCASLLFVFFSPLCLLLSLLTYTAGGGLPGDGESCADAGDSIRPPVWEGHRQRWPLGGLQRAAVGAKESGDGDSLGSSQLDSLLRSTQEKREGLSEKYAGFLSFFMSAVAGVRGITGIKHGSARLLCRHTWAAQS